ncbi:MAG: hypothetical protein DIKNOCCD_01247 [bacterium]|nr:hypothetical protein [bacterium]
MTNPAEKPMNNHSGGTPSEDTSLDLSGVVCPINFVKTKLKLESLSSGQILRVVLDKGEPLRNVPRSIRQEGHAILYAEEHGEQGWLWIRKK